jgi:hypothetical protein
MIYPIALDKTIFTATAAVFLLILSGCSDTQSHRADRPIIELNTDRPGSDISTMALAKSNPALCHDACKSNDECVAWTYIKPGIINAKAHCRLKSEMPEPRRSSCCISGRK